MTLIATDPCEEVFLNGYIRKLIVSNKRRYLKTFLVLSSPLPELYHQQNEELTYTELIEVYDQITIVIIGEDLTKIKAFIRS